ncbi:MAG: alpha/beta hydrolase [Promethearchaeota archaeon]|jgi:alpha-beta hydrolase superfamily lysophospholipase
MRHIEGNFKGVDETKLYFQAWLPENDPKSIILSAHGFASHSGRFINVVNALIPLDLAIFANDHRGHGKSGGKSNFVKSMDQYVEDEKFFYDVVKEKYPNLPIFMLGHSMGAGITVNFANKYENLLKGIILSGAGTKYGGDEVSRLVKSLAKIMSNIAPKLSAKTGLDPTLLSHDTEVVKAYIEDPLVHYKKTTTRQAHAMFDSFEKLPSIIKNIKLPILVQKGLADATVTGYNELKTSLKSDNVTIIEYEGLYHEIYNELDTDRKRVLKDLSNWIESQI